MRRLLLYAGSEDEEIKAINRNISDHTMRKSDGEISPEQHVTIVDSKIANNQKEKPTRYHGSLDMLTRVFPFHPKNTVENVLETCGGDVAKAVQQLVGHQNTNVNSNDNSAAPRSPIANLPSPPSKIKVQNKSAFHSPSSQGTSSNLAMPQISNAQSQTMPAPISSPTTASTLLAYPSALRMMSNYPSSGMMSFLHPSAAYFAAAAAAASNPQSYSWLFPGNNLYNRNNSMLSSHVCLPGCSACPMALDGGSSGQSSIDNNKIISLSSRNTC